MSGRIYHRDSFSSDGDTTKHEEENQLVPVNHHHELEMYQKHIPPPGTYVVQIPKDQIYRIPPPENARLFENYTRRKTRQNRCCRCLFWILSLISLLILLSAIAAGIFYFVVRPKSLKYSVDKISIKGFNSGLTISPEFDVTIRTQNPNKKISFYYEKGSSVTVSHSTVKLSTGTLTAFYQPTKNVTVFQTALTGQGVNLSKEVRATLMEEEKGGNIPLEFDFKLPVKVKVSAVKTWTITVKVHCDVAVDKLTVDSTIVKNKCDVKVKL
ncbi:Late embryogenesis abundant protein [Macleaya cordata]|uniref:Late embryogenesis abundant protein n=1 Tax=Macleaya cordata TaxID=56857 RepID=A0A200QNW9_MACCD|nr:Late embryogenesis abundant protein [Macleaya cordata]